ncbi:phosphotransferase family protein [Actinopolymorpha alba]|uniref:phosphotransferase family protein n=1 Tax=Actinopolymorpha alba TaxID=533267 RepID=UPI00035D9A83|nr:phosphotransferase [Actinopolymorpha alba]
MRRLPHGYTNLTVGDGSVVVKTYAGPDGPKRRERERAVLGELAGRLPIPPLLADDGTELRVGFMPGIHGQELLAPDVDSGQARSVLAACGATLARIHRTELEGLPHVLHPVAAARTEATTRTAGRVLVHGDYGPNNLLLDPATTTVTAVLDWEFAHIGDPVEDLAWCEWIVRTHHPDRIGLLDAFFDAYAGEIPPWPVRKAAMIARCEELLAFCIRWDPDGSGVAQWRQRLADTSVWRT